jgi:hypothetical protein
LQQTTLLNFKKTYLINPVTKTKRRLRLSIVILIISEAFFLEYIQEDACPKLSVAREADGKMVQHRKQGHGDTSWGNEIQ